MVESFIYELRANDVKEEHIEQIMNRVKNRLTEENVDSELQKLGYAKIFTVDYDDYDDFYNYDLDDES
ncbi:hypothetical protein [Halarcobacter bivalviorum]|uniref:Uncharacterized protein n=1 Tax=Halarcobacter bivalviorum TaxID=663364 RepID=A0AAX2A852_9BACT|nr:hypothetical protein [Halarcobacter bivalviorum]AXH11141.1 hypothetical protein ABIV_0101 [Halarcobacter bivalviorum]RXK06509.1 hypothetical protein CRU97_04610 [Halarcobacter bivalviorum]RXK09674.1 hypothetical protein CRV05_08035 [Halarcobacter bivalviorum]